MDKKEQPLFILGSGMSKDIANIPTLAEISFLLNERYSELPKPIQEFLKTIPSILHRNVEDLLSYLLMDLPWSKAVDSHLRKATFLELSKKFAQLIVERENSAEVGSEHFVRLVELWHDSEVDVITFNYDTLVESVVKNNLRKKVLYIQATFSGHGESGNTYKVFLHRVLQSSAEPLINFNNQEKTLHLNIKSGFSDEISPDSFTLWKSSLLGDERYNTIPDEIKTWIGGLDPNSHSQALNHRIDLAPIYTIPLAHVQSRDGSAILAGEHQDTFRYFKLHGSVNWYYTGLHEISDETIYYDPLINSSEIQPYLKGLTPLIIPPVIDKNSFYKNFTLSVQWQDALEAINNDRLTEIYFVGYSLPPTDIVIRNFLRSSLKGNKIKIFIVSCFPNNQQKKIVLSNYMNVLVPKSQEEIENLISQILESDEFIVDGLTFNTSLSIHNQSESSIANLVRFLEDR